MGDAVPGWGSGPCCRVKDFSKQKGKRCLKEQERDGVAIFTTKGSFFILGICEKKKQSSENLYIERKSGGEKKPLFFVCFT